MDDQALHYLDSSDGWHVGTSPTLVYGEEGWSSSMNLSDLKVNVIVVFFNQKALMGGGGLQGTKITRINPG